MHCSEFNKIQNKPDRFNDEEEMYAWGGTLDNIADQTQTHSYQNSTGLSYGNNSGIDYGSLRNADILVASSTRQLVFLFKIIPFYNLLRNSIAI